MEYILSQEDIETIEQEAHAFDLTIHFDYSGRGMFGETCFGLSGDRQQIWQVIHELIQIGGEQFVYALATAPYTDLLGNGQIWYWPSITKAAD